jgi:Trypsin-like peptidase domain/FG-GAP-like repeat
MMVIGGSPAVLAMMALLLSTTAVGRAEAQPAPIPRAVVPADAAPEAMSDLYTPLEPGEKTISIEGAEWLQIKFADFDLGTDGVLEISTETDQSQTFTQDQLEDWEGLTAIFNGSQLTLTLTPGESDEISATIEEIIIGLPGQDVERAESAAPEPLRNLLGDDLDRYIPRDPPRQPEGSAVQPEGAAEAICGANDDRVASNHPLSGRIMPIGCTGWIIQSGALLTAGHCINSSTQTVEFNVPASQSNGTTVSPAIRDQYRVIASSIVDAFTGVGNDWALLRVLPNTETGLTPIAAQGGAFQLSNTTDPTDVRITGYGVDGPGPSDGGTFGNGPPWNADNQTQQTHTGALTEHSVGGPNSATLRYAVDTQGGNSGSPVLVEGGGDVGIGIHTNAGCSADGGANAGTSFRNQGLWAAIGNSFFSNPQPVINNLAYEAGGWRVEKHPRLLGDINGDQRQDIVAFGDHHVFVALGQSNGTFSNPQPVINNLAYEAGGWRVEKHPRLLGDADGDGREDIGAFGDHHVFVALAQAES